MMGSKTALLVAFVICASSPAMAAPVTSIFIKPVQESEILSGIPYGDWKPHGKDPSLNDVLIGGGLHIGAETQKAVSDALVQGGYQIAATPDAADAIVDIDVHHPMYFQIGLFGGNDCEPYAEFNVLVKDAKSGRKIIDNTYRLQSGGGTGLTGHILLDAGKAYNVDDCASLWQKPDTGIAGFRFGIDAMAHALNSDLHKADGK